MSQESFLEFLLAAHRDNEMLNTYNQRNLNQLLFHARNEGFEFTTDDVAQVVGAMEANVILAKDRDPFNSTSRLWRQMWGRYHLEYLVNHVLSRYTGDELRVLIAKHKQEAV